MNLGRSLKKTFFWKSIDIMSYLIVAVIFAFVLHIGGAIGQEEDDDDSSHGGKAAKDFGITTTYSEIINEVNRSIERKNTFIFNGKKFEYLITFPRGYAQTTNQWPLILFLHGSSGRGTDLNLVKRYGPPFIATQQLDFPFIVLAPQCPVGEYWTANAEMLVALLDDVLKRCRIDQERVYLTGTSMGGDGTWNLACQHPEYFAAIAPLASSPQIPEKWNIRLIGMPTWVFHGERDAVCLLKNDQAMISALRMQGGAPHLTILPDQGHYIAGVYRDHRLYEWFLANTRRDWES